MSDVPPVRAWEVVLSTLEADLRAGRVSPGDRLPAERVLAESLGISRSSVREAMRVLEALGLVRTAAGQGRSSGAVLVSEPGAAIGVALRMHLAAGSLPLQDLVDTRVVLERAAVASAAELVRSGARPPALAPAADLLAQMREPDLSPERFHTLDAGFHEALARASGNAVVAVVMASLRGAIEGYVLDGVSRLTDWEQVGHGLRLEHAAVLRAVSEGDAERASRLVERHIRGFHGRTARG